MLKSTRVGTTDATKDIRSEMGLWLKGLREGAGLSQRDLAEALGLEYYTFVSQLENGRGRIPTKRYAEWADALGMDRVVFTRRILSYYEPHAHDILFGKGGDAPGE